jgi:carboxypeptidase C (cathepsin A)
MKTRKFLPGMNDGGSSCNVTETTPLSVYAKRILAVETADFASETREIKSRSRRNLLRWMASIGLALGTCLLISLLIVTSSENTSLREQFHQETIKTSTKSFNDAVHFIPGFGTPLEKQYAGLVLVNEKAQGNLFYWFFETRNCSFQSKESIPIMIWLNGGPGASSMTGLLTEMGPYRILRDRKLIPHQHSWTNVGHMLFFDQPVGTGYTYVRDDIGYVNTQEQMAHQLYKGILGFLKRHPEYAKNPVYICGESYAGKYIPHIAHYIHKKNLQLGYDPMTGLTSRENQEEKEDIIYLTGIAIGNGIMWPVLQTRSVPDYAIALGLIDLQEYEKANIAISSCEEFHRQGRHIDAFRICQTVEDEIYRKAGIPFVYDIRKSEDEFGDLTKILSEYFNNDDVRRALNVHIGTPWTSVDGSAFGVSNAAPPLARHLLADEMLDVPIDVFRDLLDNYKFLFYAGNMDGSSCNNLGIGRMIDRLAWTGTVDYRNAQRKTWKVDGKVAGLAKSSGNMSYVVVTNCGHLVPTDQPIAALDMIEKFINNIPF